MTAEKEWHDMPDAKTILLALTGAAAGAGGTITAQQMTRERAVASQHPEQTLERFRGHFGRANTARITVKPSGFEIVTAWAYGGPDDYLVASFVDGELALGPAAVTFEHLYATVAAQHDDAVAITTPGAVAGE